jgi:hypothetical protein
MMELGCIAEDVSTVKQGGRGKGEDREWTDFQVKLKSRRLLKPRNAPM